jgi:hypothetical protein
MRNLTFNEQTKIFILFTSYLLETIMLLGSVLAKEQILCRHSGKPDVVITMRARTQFGRILNCISGSISIQLLAIFG